MLINSRYNLKIYTFLTVETAHQIAIDKIFNYIYIIYCIKVKTDRRCMWFKKRKSNNQISIFYT